MERKRLTKHDQYVEALKERISSRYDRIVTNYKVYGPKRIIAEADLVGFKDDRADIYEVKCSYRPAKAKAQLRKLKRVLKNHVTVGSLFFYPANTERIYRYTER